MSTHHRTLFTVAVFALFGLTLAWGYGEWSSEKGHEEKVTLDQVPAAVKTTIELEAKNGTLKEIDKRTAEGKTAYAARIAVNGNEQETVIGEDGKVMSRGPADEDDDD